MEVLKLMLRQRKLNTDVSQTIESEFPAVITKIDTAVVFMSNRSRVNERDIETIMGITQQNGGTFSIIVVPIQPSSAILTAVRRNSKHVQIFHVGQLQFDIMTHRKVPPHRILDAEEVRLFQERYHVTDPSKEMQFIDSQDAAAKWIGAIPGDIVEIIRKSDSAGSTPYYRYCVADTSL
jgi:DNA-directed RNA polymerase subunit H (RpoH/RPB5)